VRQLEYFFISFILQWLKFSGTGRRPLEGPQMSRHVWTIVGFALAATWLVVFAVAAAAGPT
jgi:hypothetical protein